MNWKPYVTFAVVSLLGHAAGMNAFAAAKISQQGNATVLTVPDSEAQAGADSIDYANAVPLDLPQGPVRSAAEEQADLINALMSPATAGTPGFSPGGRGNGKLSPTFLGAPHAAVSGALDVEPQEFGTNNHPFSTARADLLTLATNTQYPYRASGKLFFKIGTGNFVCSASLIKRGLVVTAAHCVSNFGKRQFYTAFSFVPGYRNGVAPFQTWAAQSVIVMTSYFVGTDPCAVSGVVCQNDIAVIRLVPKTGTALVFPGTATGWYGYGWNGFGFTTGGLTHITQIGYPVCLDNGQFMERNDSHGVKTASLSNNTVIGSLMCGGSSGGPWLVNFGIRPTLTGTTNGTAPNPNIVVGVTSWGFTSTAPKEQGASPFLSTNILVLVNSACGSPVNQPACQ
jgi:V8-like Glu-specific endopeptidase